MVIAMIRARIPNELSKNILTLSKNCVLAYHYTYHCRVLHISTVT
jgi:hypothetical protein